MALKKRQPKYVFDSSRLLGTARAVVRSEADALRGLLESMDGAFVEAAGLLLGCGGHVVVTGMGKSGLIGRKISATLASTGTPSFFVHAADALHGDLGRLTPTDTVLALSNSGESDELLRLARFAQGLGISLIAMVGQPDSPLARCANVVLSIGQVVEACSMGLVPTTSSTAMMVLGDALAMGVFEARGLGERDYIRFHPGGHLGRTLTQVHEVMRVAAHNPVVSKEATLADAIAVMTETQGRPGATSVVDDSGRLVGFFTDGDLRRLVCQPGFSVAMTLGEVMHVNPQSVTPSRPVTEAVQVMRACAIDQVPVVDARGIPVGFLDVQDLLRARLIEGSTPELIENV